VDLANLDLDDLADRVLSGVLEAGEIDEAKVGIVAWVEALRGAGAEALYVLVDPMDLPGLPVVVVPLAEGSDGEAIGRILCGDAEGEPPVAWPTCAIIRGAVFAGSDAALERIQAAGATPRPELDEAFAASGDGPARLLIVPSTNQRRVIEELMPRLPESFGGLETAPITRGMRWAVLGLETEPGVRLRGIIQSSDAGVAGDLAGEFREAMSRLGKGLRDDQSMSAFVSNLERIEIEGAGDRLVLAADLEQAGELVGAPVRKARAEAKRSRSMNTMKTFGLAMHNYAFNQKSTFPPAYTVDEGGKPLLSWRVHILPYIEQKSLYDEFHLDEPWDSPHNAALIGRMPELYRGPGVSEEGMTNYLVPRGRDTIFPGAEGVTLKEILDGTSFTLLVVEANPAHAVVWTKPDDWEVDEGADPGTLLGNHPGGFVAGFADGSARFIREALGPELLKALTTISGGEVISTDDF
jgi:hypothetical protein